MKIYKLTLEYWTFGFNSTAKETVGYFKTQESALKRAEEMSEEVKKKHGKWDPRLTVDEFEVQE